MPVTAAVFGIVINTAKISAADAPKSWKDLIDPNMPASWGCSIFPSLVEATP